MLEGFAETYGLVSLLVNELRAAGQGVMAHPTAKEPWHAVVFSTGGNKKTVAQQSELARKSKWVIVPKKN
jgi:alkylated DNA nucleotide flippase Atl1